MQLTVAMFCIDLTCVNKDMPLEKTQPPGSFNSVSMPLAAQTSKPHYPHRLLCPRTAKSGISIMDACSHRANASSNATKPAATTLLLASRHEADA